MRPEASQPPWKPISAAGLRPFCVVATVGTTSTTSIDPVPAIADIAGRHGLWLHVDAAYAGSAAIVPEFRHILDGAERADSLVVNPHKWFFTPFDLSAFYTRRPDILRRAFSLVPEYLRTAQDGRAVNYMDYGVPLGRRFRALKLWFVMRYFGREKLAEMIRSQIAMGAGTGRRGGCRSALRAHRAPAVFGGLLPLQGYGRRKSPAARNRERLRRVFPLAHGVARPSTRCTWRSETWAPRATTSCGHGRWCGAQCDGCWGSMERPN